MPRPLPALCPAGDMRSGYPTRPGPFLLLAALWPACTVTRRQTRQARPSSVQGARANPHCRSNRPTNRPPPLPRLSLGEQFVLHMEQQGGAVSQTGVVVLVCSEVKGESSVQSVGGEVCVVESEALHCSVGRVAVGSAVPSPSGKRRASCCCSKRRRLPLLGGQGVHHLVEEVVALQQGRQKKKQC